VEASYFDPETVTSTPQSQLNAYLLEKNDKKEVRKMQFGGYHLPAEDSMDSVVVSSLSRASVVVVKEEGSVQPPPSP
jgi:hypothetical protein